VAGATKCSCAGPGLPYYGMPSSVVRVWAVRFSLAAFEPEMLAVMIEAFEAACIVGQPDVARDVIALRITTAAMLGERDPVRLREAALKTD
jgi:hypothetical protein